MWDKLFFCGWVFYDGVMYWSGKLNNVLMFFCDVDIIFCLEFFWRCWMYVELEKKVYYLMVFSLYNLVNVYEDGIVLLFLE